MEKTKKSGFATASLVLGIIGLCTSFIPIVNNLSFILALIGIVFSIVALAQKASKGMAIAGIIVCILTIIFTINAQKAIVETIDTAVNDFNSNMDTLSGGKTEELLANNVDVKIGEFVATKDKYGLVDTELPVTVKNKGNDTKSFNIKIEATDSNGDRISIDYIYANDLSAGQSQSFKLFEYVESEKLEDMKKATFKIVEVSMY